MQEHAELQTNLKDSEISMVSRGRSATSPAGVRKMATRRSAAAADASDSTAVARLRLMTCARLSA